MIALTQDLNRLTLHANFEAVCLLPDAVSSVTHLCDKVREVAPDFFSNNDEFVFFYEDTVAEYSDSYLMVEALKTIHAQTLIEDDSSGFYAALGRYGIPHLPDEAEWGDTVKQLLDKLLSYSNSQAVPASLVPRTSNPNISYANFMNTGSDCFPKPDRPYFGSSRYVVADYTRPLQELVLEVFAAVSLDSTCNVVITANKSWKSNANQMGLVERFEASQGGCIEIFFQEMEEVHGYASAVLSSAIRYSPATYLESMLNCNTQYAQTIDFLDQRFVVAAQDFGFLPSHKATDSANKVQQ